MLTLVTMQKVLKVLLAGSFKRVGIKGHGILISELVLQRPWSDEDVIISTI